MFINSKFITDFQEKANALNSFFAKQCSPIPSSSVLPAKISYMTKNQINTLCFGKSDVMMAIQALDVSKAQGHDRISIKGLFKNDFTGVGGQGLTKISDKVT